MATRGRPTKYSVEVADKICELIATTSIGLHILCKQDDDLPGFSTILQWLNEEDKKDFAEKYARAREAQADFLADEIIAIADDGNNDNETRYDVNGQPYIVENKEWTSRSKLKVEARKWKASKLNSKKYGDKSSIEMKISKVGKDLADEEYD